MRRLISTLSALLFCVFFAFSGSAQCPVTITLQPADTAICSGNDAAFIITATGIDTLQWQVSTNGGGTWTDVSNNGLYSGATNDTLIIAAATAGMHNNLYRCLAISTATPCSITSDSAALLINTAPVITTQPVNVTTCSLTNAVFSVTATNVASYSWQLSTDGGVSWAKIVGAASASYTATAVTLPMSGNKYRCIVTTTCGVNDTTDEATLTVNTSATIGKHPITHNVCPGGTTKFIQAGAGFGPFQYEWAVSTDGGATWNIIAADGGAYSGVATDTLTISGATAAMHGYQYRGTVTGGCSPSVTTNAATLRVLTVPAVVSSPDNVTACLGGDTYFICEASGSAIGYQWQVSTDGGAIYLNINDGGIYAGTSTDSLSITGVPATAHGYLYRCKINNVCGPTVTSDAGELSIAENPTVTAQPVSTTVCTGTTGAMSVAATGYNITYQWQVSSDAGATWTDVTDDSVYNGAATNTLQFANPTGTIDGNQYHCVVTNACMISAVSNAATLTVQTAPVISTQPDDVTICYGANASFSVSATSATTISYQWQGSADGIAWTNLTSTGVYSGATTPTLSINQPYVGVWTKYRCALNTGCTPAVTTETATLTINNQPNISVQPVDDNTCLGGNASFALSATGTGLSYQWEESTDQGANWNVVADGGVYAGATTNTLLLTNLPTSMNGYKYRCIVSGTCPTAKVSDTAELTVNTPVALTSNTPTALTFCSGSDTTLAVTATGTGLSYQWYSNTGGNWNALSDGGIYSGVNTPTLTLTGIPAPTTTETYVYYCVVTGACNMVGSNATYITVHAKPTIVTNPADVTKCDSMHNASFKVIATGTNLTYQWQLNTGSGWNNLVNNSTYSGATTSELLIPNVYMPMDGYEYRCIINGLCSPGVTTEPATLTMNDQVPTSVSVAASAEDICAGTSVTFTPSPVNGGNSPTYEWKVNNVTAGTGSTFTTSTLGNGDIIYCVMTSNGICPTPRISRSDNTISMQVSPTVTPTITITSPAGASWCVGKPLTFRANVSGEGISPAYAWEINGVAVGTSVDTYLTSTLVDGDKVVCKLTSSERCALPVTVTSNEMQMTINPVVKGSINIVPNPDSLICDGEKVTIYTYFTHGGTAPTFQWIMNGKDIPGETGGSFTSGSLKDGDAVQCRMTSNATCVFPELSPVVEFEVVPFIDPSVTIAMYHIGNNTYRFEAKPTNGGSNPAYQWYKNNVPVAGATSETFDVTGLLKTDRIHVAMVSSERCVNPELLTVSSKKIATSVEEFTGSFSDLWLYPNPNSGQFYIKGSLNSAVNNKDVVVNITNQLGQVVFTNVYKANGTEINLPVVLNNVVNGMYQVNIITGGEMSNLRFVLNR